MRIRVRFLALIPFLTGIVLADSLTAHATILTFELGDYGVLSSYGDNIDQSVVGGVTYSEGAGFTPDITIDFVPDTGFGAYSVVPSGYASLVNALGHGWFDVPGEIILSPAGGAEVALYGFDLATWVTGTYATDVRIWDDNGTRSSPNLLIYNQTMLPSAIYQPLQSVIRADGPLHIYINNLGSTGLDNLHFAQVVPEPTTSILLGGGVLCLAARRRRRNH